MPGFPVQTLGSHQPPPYSPSRYAWRWWWLCWWWSWWCWSKPSWWCWRSWWWWKGRLQLRLSPKKAEEMGGVIRMGAFAKQPKPFSFLPSFAFNPRPSWTELSFQGFQIFDLEDFSMSSCCECGKTRRAWTGLTKWLQGFVQIQMMLFTNIMLWWWWWWWQ